MEMGGQLHAPAVLPPMKNHLLVGSQSVSALLEKRKCLVLAGNRSPGQPSHCSRFLHSGESGGSTCSCFLHWIAVAVRSRRHLCRQHAVACQSHIGPHSAAVTSCVASNAKSNIVQLQFLRCWTRFRATPLQIQLSVFLSFCTPNSKPA